MFEIFSMFVTIPMVSFALAWMWFERARGVTFYDEENHRRYREYRKMGAVWYWAGMSCTVNSTGYIAAMIWPQVFSFIPPLNYSLLGGVFIMLVTMVIAIFLSKKHL